MTMRTTLRTLSTMMTWKRMTRSLRMIMTTCDGTGMLTYMNMTTPLRRLMTSLKTLLKLMMNMSIKSWGIYLTMILSKMTLL